METNQLTVASNGRVSKEQILAVSDKLGELEKRDSILTPQAVVEEARSESSPLHRFFTWDDTEAAEKHRLWEARKLIHTVRVVIDIGGGDSVSSRGFVNLRLNVGQVSTQGYHGIVKVLSDTDMRLALIAKARKELAEFKARYKELTEFAAVFAAIDEVNNQQ